MYSSQDLSRLGSIEQEIREGRFKLINYKNIVPGDSSFNNYNIAYILVTQSSMVPLFYTFTDEDIVKHNLVYSTTFNQASLSDELNLNILFPKKIEGDINFITIDVAINVQDLEVMN